LPSGPGEAKRFLDPDQAKLYEMIWPARTVAKQMESAPTELESTTADHK